MQKYYDTNARIEEGYFSCNEARDANFVLKSKCTYTHEADAHHTCSTMRLCVSMRVRLRSIMRATSQMHFEERLPLCRHDRNTFNATSLLTAKTTALNGNHCIIYYYCRIRISRINFQNTAWLWKVNKAVYMVFIVPKSYLQRYHTEILYGITQLNTIRSWNANTTFLKVRIVSNIIHCYLYVIW